MASPNLMALCLVLTQEETTLSQSLTTLLSSFPGCSSFYGNLYMTPLW